MTTFDAIVDGTSGDTYLQPVEGKLGQTKLTVRGAAINIKGVGHREDLDVDVSAGAVEDFLDLAVKTQPPVLTGIINTKFKLIIEPGTESVTRKLKSRGGFQVRRLHFTNAAVQDKVDMLSLRARGEPKEAKAGAEDVNSFFKGDFAIEEGKIIFRQLSYTLPGAQVNLSGVYSMDGQQFDFTGKVLTKATLRKMVASWWKSWLLTPVSPFFKKDGAGAEIPVRIDGRSAPKFGLNLFRDSNHDKGHTKDQDK